MGIILYNKDVGATDDGCYLPLVKKITVQFGRQAVIFFYRLSKKE